MLIGVESLLVSAIVICKDIPLVVLVVKVGYKCRAWLFYLLDCFFSNDLGNIVIYIAITSPNKAPLFRYKLIIILLFINLLLASKGGHPEIIGIHGPTHSVNKSWLILVHKAIHLVGVCLYFFPFLHHVPVWFIRFHLTTLPLTVVFFILVHATKVDSLLVLEGLHYVALFDTIVQ